MENAVDALKLAFAVLVFVIALTLTFSIVGQARVTSDIILALNDKTNYYEYVEENEVNAKNKGKDRIVGFDTILPTIYRYAKEQYAVTILDTDGTPIVRYDLYTEGFMSGWDETLKRQQRTGNDSEYEEIQKRIEIVDDYIRSELNKNATDKPIWDSLVKESSGIYTAGTLYKGSNINNNSIKSVAPWMGDPNRDTILRIKADLGTALENNNKYIKNGVTYIGKNLSQYKNRTFIEKFLEIQTSGKTIIEKDEDNDNIEYSLETIKGNKKLEIIYILQ